MNEDSKHNGGEILLDVRLEHELSPESTVQKGHSASSGPPAPRVTWR
jgi:hypothetical protein